MHGGVALRNAKKVHKIVAAMIAKRRDRTGEVVLRHKMCDTQVRLGRGTKDWAIVTHIFFQESGHGNNYSITRISVILPAL